MEELKFDPSRMREGKIRIDRVTLQLREYLEETMTLAARLESEGDSRLKPRESVEQPRVTRSLREIGIALDGIERLSGKLEQLADLYENCERAVAERAGGIRRAAARRETASPQAAPRAGFSAEYAASYTIPRDLIVESWLLELMFAENSGS
ncbi:MAG: hypothetical protein LBK41_07970 [Clostridiales bacterium]|jgi:hypothetical protein|nr:hypothetical protein [Clostridiales bacterium]